ncbi:MAG: SRPBCC family protein [Gemmatimonadaceae bacterium]
MENTTPVSAAATRRPASRPRRRARGANADRNVGRTERALSVAGGGLLAAYGLKRRGVGGAALALAGAVLVRRGATGHCPVYQALDIDRTDERGRSWLVRQHGPSAVLDARRAERVVRSVTIARPRAELYRFWRDLENLPRIMRNVESVTVLNQRRSHWTARGPAGRSVEWDAVINNERENELIGWKSVPGTDVPNAGSVRFTDAADGTGTEVQVTLEYVAPGGSVGAAVARLFGDDPGRQIEQDLRVFKESMESIERGSAVGGPAAAAAAADGGSTGRPSR